MSTEYSFSNFNFWQGLRSLKILLGIGIAFLKVKESESDFHSFSLGKQASSS